jgi:hypothetical protein
MSNVPVHEEGYDYSALGAEGRTVLTPAVRELAGEILDKYWECKAREDRPPLDRVEVDVSSLTKVGLLHKVFRRLWEPEQETLHLTVS